jgi:hypothetical protein
LEQNANDCWFQHDGTTAQNAKTIGLLQEFFGERIVGRGLWPLQSTDISSQSVDELKHNIEETFANTDIETLRTAT